MGNVKRIYVEKKAPFAAAAKQLQEEIKSYLQIDSVEAVRMFIRYDVENLSDEVYAAALKSVFSEPPVDIYYEEKIDIPERARVFSVEYLPGQFDQRADSALQCVKFLKEDEEPVIRTAVTYMVIGDVSEEEFEQIRHYCINPVDSRETGMEKPETLMTAYEELEDVKILENMPGCEDFVDMPEAELKELYDSLGLAMTFRDFQHIQNYFAAEEKRNPTMTEIRVLDTYWSDHCRHTTFATELKEVEFGEGYYKEPLEMTWQSYLDTREELYAGRDDKFICLMDIALMAMKKLRAEGKLEDMEVSDEINACSVVVPVEVDYGDGPITEEWLVFFKNETHNHPTEIEPFGGAATCLGGAIRDPLSGRGYVYQAMRVTGAADPTLPASQTLKGKLSQARLVRGAAKGYSSYGNQVGLATGYVKEIYHRNYVAKRMEIGAVMGAAPRRNVIRENADPGDCIILLGGRTGRDGCGGATGSSKAHTEESTLVCGAEVQKGNAPTERKIQRLFRREEVSRLIKKCNDFGAGGVSVAIGELADGLLIDLDAGLDGTELAISESQERMAVVVSPKDKEAFLEYAAEENLEAVVVAKVTKEPRLILKWRGREIVNIARAFLDTNGAHQETSVKVAIPSREENRLKKTAIPAVEEALQEGDLKKAWLTEMSDLNVCSQKGLVEMFDSSIGSASVLMPYGGKYQLTETQVMAAKLPVLSGKTDTATMMSYGFDPEISSWSPYHGAVYAVTESMAKIVAAGGDCRKIRFTFQEYFRRMSERPERWSQPFAALLGAYDAQVGFGLPSIGGKDSMSGTFQDIDVPPTLVSFAVDVAKEKDIVTPELKAAGNKLVYFKIDVDEYDIPNYANVLELYEGISALMKEGILVSAYAVDAKGICAAVSKMAFGNKLGVRFDPEKIEKEELFACGLGNIIAEVDAAKLEELEKTADNLDVDYRMIAEVIKEAAFVYNDVKISLEEALESWRGTLDKVFPYKASKDVSAVESPVYRADSVYVCRHKVARPCVFIPVFPGTNCEYDAEKAFRRAGAEVVTKVFKNRTAEDIRESVEVFEKAISRSQIIMFPGGFSAGDEPDGSAKFFATAFQNEKIKEAVQKLLSERDGLALGICNGFQALIKLGLVPCGEIVGQNGDSPTLTFNTINRHISKMAYIKVVSDKSPWLSLAEPGRTYVNPASHGEGRFVASEAWLDKLFADGQVATQYVDMDGRASMDEEYNINGSYRAIEGITSPDGRCFGKMAHAERRDDGVAVNIYGEQDMKIFESGVRYFR